MQGSLHRALLLWLLELVSLSSICSSEFMKTTIKHAWTEVEGSSSAISNLEGSGSGEEGSTYSSWPSGVHSGYNHRPAAGPPWLPGANMRENHEAHEANNHFHTGSHPEQVSELCDMLLNLLVPLPADQLPFHCMCSFCKGTVGLKGKHGDQAPPGKPGSPGRRGLVGFKGHRGSTGLQGIKGQKGNAGEKGQDGKVGFMGSKGHRGFKGGKGDQGLFGPPGTQGPQGETGACPTFCQSPPGALGSKGPAGTAGGRGLPGLNGSVGPKGIRGAKGDMGRTGDHGVNGEKGNQGDEGVCECTDGMNGLDGGLGEEGIKGDKGDAGAQGAQGSEGLKGHQGEMGLQGPPGPCTPAIQSAFSASLNQSFPKSNWPVAFNQILTNKQGHFNPQMGIYTAPVNGTYVFSFHLSGARKPLRVAFFLNFNPLFITAELNQPAKTSQEIVHHLIKGDQVWLQVKDDQANGMFTDNESTSTFSGYLLQPDTCKSHVG